MARCTNSKTHWRWTNCQLRDTVLLPRSSRRRDAVRRRKSVFGRWKEMEKDKTHSWSHVSRSVSINLRKQMRDYLFKGVRNKFMWPIAIFRIRLIQDEHAWLSRSTVEHQSQQNWPRSVACLAATRKCRCHRIFCISICEEGIHNRAIRKSP